MLIVEQRIKEFKYLWLKKLMEYMRRLNEKI